MKQLFVLLLLCILITAISPFAHSEWTMRGPYSVSLGTILFLPGSPNVVLAAGRDGYYRSTDGGRTWNRQFLTYPYSSCEYPIRSFPDRQNELLAASEEVYRSTDSGLSWEYEAGSLSGEFLVCDMEISPGNPSHLIAVTDSADVFRSTDRGSTWKDSNSGIQVTPREQSIMSNPQIEFDPKKPSTVYMMPVGNKIFRSTNSGRNWKQIAQNLSRDVKAYSLAIHPANPSILFLGRDDGLFRSTDGGVRWTQTSVTRKTFQVSFNPMNASAVYATGDRFSISFDGGITWKVKDLPGCTDEFNGLGISPDGKHLLLSADGQAMLRSDDSAASWRYQPIHTALNTPFLDSLRAFADGRIVAFGYPEAYVTRNFGRTWGFFVRSQIPLREVRQVEIHRLNQKLVYASASDRLARSTDGGATWAGLSAPFEYFNGFALDPQDTKRIYVFQRSRVATTTDAGESWSFLSPVPVQELRFLMVHPTNPRILYAGARKMNQGGLYRSTDTGQSWRSWSAGIKGDAVMQLVINPANNSEMYLLEEEFGPPRSRPGQRHSEGPKIYKSVNGGQTWQLKEQGLSPDLYPQTLELDPVNSNRIYAGGYGVYVSENGADNWSAFDRSGVPSNGTRFKDLLFSPLDNRILFGVSDYWGVFTYQLNPQP